MLMELCNASGSLPTMMNEVPEGYIDRFFIVCLEELLPFSNTAQDHYIHVAQVLQRL